VVLSGGQDAEEGSKTHKDLAPGSIVVLVFVEHDLIVAFLHHGCHLLDSGVPMQHGTQVERVFDILENAVAVLQRAQEGACSDQASTASICRWRSTARARASSPVRSLALSRSARATYVAS